MEKSESIANLATALSQAQAEMPSVPFDATNAFLKNRYASLGAMIETARPVLAAHGLSVSQIVVSYEAQIGVETVLMHSSGEWISNTAILPANEEKGKSTAQVAGSMITYLRRYSYAAILGLYADEDTDGNAPQQNGKQGNQKPPQTQPQQQKPGNGGTTKRPYTPEHIQNNTKKILAGKELTPATADQVRSIQIKWKNILHHADDVRLMVASYILNRPFGSFKELFGAEIDRLTMWLADPMATRQEAQAIIDLLVYLQDEGKGQFGQMPLDGDEASEDFMAAIQGA